MSKLLVLLVLLISCSSPREKFSGYDLFSDQNKSVKLSKSLKEISGLTFDYKNRLFCHNDEIGEVFEIDFDGEIVKSFFLKDRPQEDFEDITFIDGYFYLVTSSGDIYKFSEGKDGKEVAFEFFESPLKTKFDVEGLCLDYKGKSLLLACKEFPGKGLKGNRAIYSFDLEKNELNESPQFLISVDEVKNAGFKNFNPSAIEFNQTTKSYFLVDGKNSIILETDQKGTILNISKLNKENHEQPEGLEFFHDGTMIIADEGASGKARLTFYQYSGN